MLLRSTSAPILNSWLPQHCTRESSPEPESQLQRRSRSFTLFSSKSIDGHTGEQIHSEQKFSVLKPRSNENHNENPIPCRQRRSSLDETRYTKKTLDPSSTFLVDRLFSSSGLGEKSIDGHTGEQLHQALSEKKYSVLKPRSNENHNENPVPRRQRRSSLDETRYTKKNLDPSSTFLVNRLFSSSGLGEKASNNDDRLETLVGGGGGGSGMGSSGGKICNGGGVGGSGVNGGGSEDATDTYYKEMIDLNPGNPLLTGNYAKFLKEVKGDMKKAEEYCERAILGNTNDGNVLSLYADLILHNHRDRERAHSYYQQAVKMSPEDCYVQASYARFLWDVEEDEDEGEDEEEQRSDDIGQVRPTTTFRDFPHHTSITASS